MAVEPGILYLVGTPIGNLEDITLRALRVLGVVHAIAAEDTRVTRKLLRRHGIETALLSYHRHSGEKRRAKILEMLRQGETIALVSDAGMPAISDPGAHLVADCAAAGIPVVVIPGPTALSAALAASGLLAKEFLFLGFLPARAGPRRKALQRAARQPGAIVCYEAPHRLLESLGEMRAVLGDRPAVCARELTKRFEEVVRGSLAELVARFSGGPPKGEMTVIVEGAAPAEPEADISQAVDEVRALVTAGLPTSRAVAHVAKRSGLRRSDLYRAAVEQEERSE
jgi:16S rRNA (cytidine1402-2'-O)-methyltransferase